MGVSPIRNMSARRRVLVATTYWMESIYAGIARRAAEYGWALNDCLRWQRELPQDGRTWDGAIVFAWKSRDCIERLSALRIPIVDMEDYVDHFGASKVVGDDDAVGRIAAEHLVRAGCRSLVDSMADLDSPVSRRRSRGFAEAAARAGVPVRGAHSADGMLAAVAGGERPCGVFCGTDQRAEEAERVLLDAGLRIPDDVAVLGGNDTPHLCELAPVALSSVNMDFEGKGAAAAELLRDIFEGRLTAPRRVIVPPRGVTTRASTRVPSPTGNDGFTRLTEAMERLCCGGGDIASICRAAGVSTAEARTLIRARLGRTPVEELSRLRVARAKPLLLERKMNLTAIAKACGFGTRQSLYVAFRKFENRSPEAFVSAKAGEKQKEKVRL